MTIWVSSLRDAHAVAARERPVRVVSLLDPDDVFPSFGLDDDARHLCIGVHDIGEDVYGLSAPGRRDVERLIAFLEPWEPDSTLLVHCWAGVSRSTATAFITLCLHNPGVDERLLAAGLRAASPTATPNRRIVAFADSILGRSGRMVDAAASIGRGVLPDEAALPFRLARRPAVRDAGPP